VRLFNLRASMVLVNSALIIRDTATATTPD